MGAATSVGQLPRLRRSRTDKVIGGVCGGLGAYLGVDPVWLRIAFVALALGGGSGVLLYVIAWIAIPEEDDETPIVPREPSPSGAGIIVGSVLVLIGMIALIRRYVPELTDLTWPIVLIVVGGVLVLRRWRI